MQRDVKLGGIRIASTLNRLFVSRTKLALPRFASVCLGDEAREREERKRRD
jgi:hypothetical protein